MSYEFSHTRNVETRHALSTCFADGIMTRRSDCLNCTDDNLFLNFTGFYNNGYLENNG